MKPKIVVVDDDEQIRISIEQNLKFDNDIHVFEKPKDALLKLNEIDPWLIISDQRMPEMSGIDFFRKARKIVPNAIRFLITGYSEEKLVIESIQEANVFDYIKKPFDMNFLEIRVNQAIDRFKLEQENRDLLKNLENKVEEQVKKIKLQQDALIQSEKMAGIGRFMAGINHDLKGPINFIYNILPDVKNDFETLNKIREKHTKYIKSKDNSILEEIQFIEKTSNIEDHISDSEYVFNTMKNSIQRMKTLVNNLRVFSRKSEKSIKKMSIKTIITNTVSLIPKKVLIEKEVEIKTDQISDFELMCDEGQMGQVILNLIQNAIDAMSSSGEVSIQTLKTVEKGTIFILDSGDGIPEDIIKNIFEPFFTTKPAEEGTGLGLSICYEIVTKHKGTITAESTLNEGTTFKLEFPLASNI